MKIFKNKLILQKEISKDNCLSFVPTMGGLHKGHLSLIKKAKKHNPLNQISSRLWLFTGINIIVVSFGFWNELQNHLTPIILLLLGIATAVAGSFIRSKMLLFCGVILNLGAYAAFFIPWKQHPILMGIVALVTFLLPGLLLHYKHKKKDV